MICKHKYKIVETREVGSWSDVGAIYTTLVQCEKCGKSKYISNYTEIPVRMAQGTGILAGIGFLVFLCNLLWKLVE